MGEPVAADAAEVQVAEGSLAVTVTRCTPLLQGTNNVPSRSADPPSEKQNEGLTATWPPSPPRWDWSSTYPAVDLPTSKTRPFGSRAGAPDPRS